MQNNTRILLFFLSLSLCATFPSLGTPPTTPDPSDTSYMRLNTNLGTIDVLMLTHEALNTVNNFKSYESAYVNSVIHRSATDADSGVNVIQGGEYVLGTDGYLLDYITTTTPVAGQPGDFSNIRGTIAVALGSDANNNPLINSGTSQWYFNVTNNIALDTNFTVFGFVTDPSSLSVIDQISHS